MWHRSVVAVAFSLVIALPAFAQVSSVYSQAVPPDKAIIERLNLKSEWTVNLPIDGRRDIISLIQTLDDQLFVQTRTGLVVAIDTLTGRIQWSVRLGNGGAVNTYPVATNSQFVYVANVTKLYSFHRYTGVVEFVLDLETPPTTGLTADDSGVYCILGVRVGSSGAQRIAVYNLPRPISIYKTAKVPEFDSKGKPIKDPKAVNPVDNLINRYAPEGMSRTMLPDTFDPSNRQRSVDAPVGGLSASRTPSLNSLPRVTPPYTLDNDVSTPSINPLLSLRQPYRLRDDFQKEIQQTASIGTIPPSVAAALALSDLRPKNIQPPLRWEYGATTRILYPVTVTPQRVWAFTDGHELLALNKIDKKKEVSEILADPISAPPGRAGVFLYIPLGAGYLLAIDGSKGQLGGGSTVLWRTAVGGISNRTPFVTDTMVYSEGDNSGVVCMDRKTGELLWRTEDTADRVIAANREFLYVRNRQGKFLVYDAKRATDPVGKRSMPLAGIDLSDFNIPITNRWSDRIFLAADNGLIVCMRDMSPKYARPVRICPEISVNIQPKDLPGTQPSKESLLPKDNDPADPKNEPPKNEPPKKPGM
jgi:outer membrane protein assembly factor BamB